MRQPQQYKIITYLRLWEWMLFHLCVTIRNVCPVLPFGICPRKRRICGRNLWQIIEKKWPNQTRHYKKNKHGTHFYSESIELAIDHPPNLTKLLEGLITLAFGQPWPGYIIVPCYLWLSRATMKLLSSGMPVSCGIELSKVFLFCYFCGISLVGTNVYLQQRRGESEECA